MTGDPGQSHDAQTTPVGVRTTCPQCGVQLDSFTTTCGACGAVITGGAMDAERAERVRARLQEGIGAGYKLGDMLGRGGMGIVFQARELALDRDVALKVLAFDPILNPDAYARFEREARLAARLDHPNIVPIFSVGQGNGIAFYTMRLVRGGSVEALVAGGRALEVGRALPILRDVAAALDYAHAQGVVHRDIKPANVLLGDSGHASVADFGIARAFAGPTASGATATGTGVVGSPAYMSPEQWRGERVDGRADQYALGVLAFELLAGQRPFAGDSMQELLRMHLQDDAPDIISLRHDLPSYLTNAIRRAMSKDPAARFESAGAFVAALEGKGVPAAPTQRAAPVRGGSAPTVRTPVPAGTPARTAARTPAGKAATPDSAASAVPVAAGRRRLLPWLTLLVIAAAGGGVIWKLAPPRRDATDQAAGTRPAGTTAAAPPAPSLAAPAGSVNLDSIAAIERELQAQVDEARRIALAAERRADALAASRQGGGAAPGSATQGDPTHAHLYVFAQGGAPLVVIDGSARNEVAPAVFQLAPGRHTVSVRGNQQFFPHDTTIELAPEDTETVVFRSLRFAGQRQPQQQSVGAGDPAPAKPFIPVPEGGVAQKPALPVDWPDIVRKLGFDPRTADLRRLTPEQRQRFRRFQEMMDSLRRAGARRP